MPDGAGDAPRPATTLRPQAVEFWGPDPGTTPGMAAVADAFRAKYPNLSLNVTGGALNISAESRDKFIAATVAGNPPDSTYQDRWIPQSYVVWGAISYLDDRLKRSTLKPDEWWPYLRRDVTLKGKLVGVPVHTDGRVFMWNKEHFQELGLNPDRPPANWEELTAVSARLVKRGGDGKLLRAGFMPWGGNFGTHGLPFLLHLWQAGGQTLSDDQRKVRFHEPPGIKAMDWMMTVARQIGAVRRGHRCRADLPAAPARRRAAPGRAGRGDGRRRRQGRRRSRRRGPAGGDAGRRPARRRGRRADRGAAALGQFTLQVGRPSVRCSPRPRPASTTRSKSSAARRFSRPSSTAPGCRSTARATPSRSTPAASTTSPPGCRRSSRPTLALPVTDLIADAEAIALRPDGRPAPLPGHRVAVRQPPTSQRPGPRNRCRCSSSTCCTSTAPTCWTCPRRERLAALDAVVPDHAAGGPAAPPLTPTPRSGFSTSTLAAGHEGVMAKSPAAPYEAGRRGAGWLKVKPVHTLDLVVLAVEWGSGRRTGKLSNIHLGARDPATGGFVMLGKTFKGMTDEMLAWQTARFLELADGPHRRLRGRRSGPSRSWRSRSTACRRPPAIPAAWHCDSPGCCATATTRAPAEADTVDTVRDTLRTRRMTGEAARFGQSPRAR